MSTTDAATGFDQRLVPLADQRPFADPAELTEVWGRPWGASTEVGRLRSAVVRTPGAEMLAIDVSRWRDDAGAAVDPDGRWYWLHREPPDLERMQAQHHGLVKLLRHEGVEVQVLDPLDGVFTKSIYVRDPFVIVPGGVIVTRLAPHMRRGEEAAVTRSLAALGVPILGTIVGDGLVEGGSFAKVAPGRALYGTGVRCNGSGAKQLAGLLARSGVDLTLVAQGTGALHLDGALAMVDADKALVIKRRLPWWVAPTLATMDIESIEPHPDEPWAVNLLALAPGRVVVSTSAPRTCEALRRRGVDVFEVPFDEVERNGGGVHCSTNELQRDDV